jgi:hypothetical protein
VLAELLVRDVNAYLPVVDVGVDILTMRGTRIQVKTTKLRRRKTASGYGQGPSYFFASAVKFRGSPERRRREYRFRQYVNEVDFVVYWGVDEDRFWILPASLADRTKCIVLQPKQYAGRLSGTVTDAVYAHERRWDLLGAVPEPTAHEVPPLSLVGGA